MHIYTQTYTYIHIRTYIQRGASGASHSRAQRVTHVFTWSTCLHRSHVDHFFWCTLRGFCGPSSLVVPSYLSSPGTRARGGPRGPGYVTKLAYLLGFLPEYATYIHRGHTSGRSKPEVFCKIVVSCVVVLVLASCGMHTTWHRFKVLAISPTTQFE